MQYIQALVILALTLFGSNGAQEMKDKTVVSVEPTVNSINTAEEALPTADNSIKSRILYAPLPIIPYPLFNGLPVYTTSVGAESGDPAAQARDIGASGGLNLGPIGAGFGAGLRPTGFYLGGGAGYSGNFFRPYNYQQHQAPYIYARPYNYQGVF